MTSEEAREAIRCCFSLPTNRTKLTVTPSKSRTIIDDVFTPGGPIHLPRPDGSPALRLPALLLSASGEGNELAHASCTDDLLERAEEIQATDLYVLVGTGAVQPDSAIVRRRGLWGALRARGVEFPRGTGIAEESISVEGGLRFFGAWRVDRPWPTGVSDLLGVERTSFLVLLDGPKEGHLIELCRKGWRRNGQHPESPVVAELVRAGAALVWHVGEFDDRERGVVLAAEPETLSVYVGGLDEDSRA